MKSIFRSIVCASVFAVLLVSYAAVGLAVPGETITGNYNWIGQTDWSPDGRYVVFNADSDIILVDLEENTITNLTENVDMLCALPAFSLDSSEIYYSAAPENDTNSTAESDTWAINIQTGEVRLVKENAIGYDVSFNGRYATYSIYREGIAVYDLETGEETMIGLVDGSAPPYMLNSDTPKFTYDDKHVIVMGKNAKNMYNYGLYSIDIETCEAEQIGSNWYSAANCNAFNNKVLMSESVIKSTEIPRYPFEIRDSETGEITVVTGEDRYYNIFYIYNAETGEYENLCYNNYYAVEGKQQVYAFDDGNYVPAEQIYDEDHMPLSKTRIARDQRWSVVIYDLDTEETFRIVNPMDFETKCACWSPDGTRICYVLDDGEFMSLYIYDVVEGAHKLVMLGTDEEIDTAVEESPAPEAFSIAGNFPNPFNPTTTIDFEIPEAGFVELTVYNAMGQKVASLLAEDMAPGKHHVVWNGRDDNGVSVSSGIYISRLKMRERITARQMTLVK